MASKRNLKKAISALSSDLLAAAVAKSNDIKPEELNKIIASILANETEFRKRVSHIEKAQAKAHFNQLRADFGKTVSDTADSINHGDAK